MKQLDWRHIILGMMVAFKFNGQTRTGKLVKINNNATFDVEEVRTGKVMTVMHLYYVAEIGGS